MSGTAFHAASIAGMGPVGRVPASVVHMLLEAARHHPDLPALRFEQTSLNYGQYAAAVAGLAEHWRPWLRPGDRAVLVLPNSMDLVLATYAVHALRAQAVALNPRYTERELRIMVADADPALIVYDTASGAALDAVAGALPAERRVGIAAGASLAGYRGEPDNLADLPSHDDFASLQYTSGTSGRPKGVNITHRHLACNLAQREALLPTRHGQERVLCVTPLFHVSAVAMALHLACYAASELVIHSRFDAGATLQAIGSQAITLFSAVPTVFRALLAHPMARRTDFSQLQYCYSGAAPLPESVLANWRALTGRPIIEGYGLSEAGPCLTYNPALGRQKPGSVGLPMPGSEVQIVDLATGTKPLPANEEGELRVRGPHVMHSYRNLPEATRRALRDGWLYTGDIACRDADGYVYVRGRRHDAINVGGYTVHPREIEEVLLMHPGVAQAAAFAVAHPHYGQAVQAWVVAKPGQAPDPEALRAFCAGNLVRYKVPEAIGLAAELPINPTGKLQRNKLSPVLQHTH
ncbi:MAG: AMP-binding protein [Alcaligenaceae bacterium]|nr:AMP-binding protein [Alcaligenaceae bacterium]